MSDALDALDFDTPLSRRLGEAEASVRAAAAAFESVVEEHSNFLSHYYSVDVPPGADAYWAAESFTFDVVGDLAAAAHFDRRAAVVLRAFLTFRKARFDLAQIGERG